MMHFCIHAYDPFFAVWSVLYSWHCHRLTLMTMVMLAGSIQERFLLLVEPSCELPFECRMTKYSNNYGNFIFPLETKVVGRLVLWEEI